MNLPTLLRKLTAPQAIMVVTTLTSLLAFISERLKRWLVLNAVAVRRGQVHRLFTAGWIHKDAMHLLTNMLVLWFFSRRALRGLGSAPYLALYLSAVVMAYLPTAVRYRNDPNYNSLGASGAVAAVMLSAIMLDPMWTFRLLWFPVAIPAVVFGAAYMAYSVWHSWSAKDRINHDAHFTGALYGAAFTYLFAPAKVALSVTVLRTFVRRHTGW